MLINKLGVESDAEITQLGERRPVPAPKNRETMTALLQSSLAPVTRAELLSTPVTEDAAVLSMETSAAHDDEDACTDVA